MPNTDVQSSGVLASVAATSAPITGVATTSAPITSITASVPPITSVMTATMALFPTTLAASQAAGVAAIRLTRVGTDLQVEELNAIEATIIGFVMHPLLSSTKQVTAIAITQMGQSSVPSPLTPAQKAALTLIANELKQFTASGAPTSPPGRPRGLDRSSGSPGFFEEALVALDCAGAVLEGGANPIADVGCIAGFTLVVTEADNDGSGDDDGSGSDTGGGAGNGANSGDGDDDGDGGDDGGAAGSGGSGGGNNDTGSDDGTKLN